MCVLLPQDIDGKPTKLERYKGKAVLVVNLASACGFTPQYAELQELYQKYSSKGLVVLGFPVSSHTHPMSTASRPRGPGVAAPDACSRLATMAAQGQHC